MIPLSLDFVLGPNDVLCGRTRDCSDHIGNKRFMEIVKEYLPLYIKAASKHEKSAIILDVIGCVENKSRNGGFVRYNPLTDQYYRVNEKAAREKTSQAFRDALKRSSKQSFQSKYIQARTKEQRKLSSSYANKGVACNLPSPPYEHGVPDVSPEFNYGPQIVTGSEMKTGNECTKSMAFNKIRECIGNHEEDVLDRNMQAHFSIDDFHMYAKSLDDCFFYPVDTAPASSESHNLPSSCMHKVKSFEPFQCFEVQKSDYRRTYGQGSTIKEHDWFEKINCGDHDDPFEPVPLYEDTTRMTVPAVDAYDIPPGRITYTFI